MQVNTLLCAKEDRGLTWLQPINLPTTCTAAILTMHTLFRIGILLPYTHCSQAFLMLSKTELVHRKNNLAKSPQSHRPCGHNMQLVGLVPQS